MSENTETDRNLIHESEAACSDWPGACQCTPAHDNGRLTPEPRVTRPGAEADRG